MLGVSVNPVEEVEKRDEEAEAGARVSEWDGERIIVYMARDGQLHAIQVRKTDPSLGDPTRHQCYLVGDFRDFPPSIHCLREVARASRDVHHGGFFTEFPQCV